MSLSIQWLTNMNEFVEETNFSDYQYAEITFASGSIEKDVPVGVALASAKAYEPVAVLMTGRGSAADEIAEVKKQFGVGSQLAIAAENEIRRVHGLPIRENVPAMPMHCQDCGEPHAFDPKVHYYRYACPVCVARSATFDKVEAAFEEIARIVDNIFDLAEAAWRTDPRVAAFVKRAAEIEGLDLESRSNDARAIEQRVQGRDRRDNVEDHLMGVDHEGLWSYWWNRIVEILTDQFYRGDTTEWPLREMIHEDDYDD